MSRIPQNRITVCFNLLIDQEPKLSQTISKSSQKRNKEGKGERRKEKTSIVCLDQRNLSIYLKTDTKLFYKAYMLQTDQTSRIFRKNCHFKPPCPLEQSAYVSIRTNIASTVSLLGPGTVVDHSTKCKQIPMSLCPQIGSKMVVTAINIKMSI